MAARYSFKNIAPARPPRRKVDDVSIPMPGTKPHEARSAFTSCRRRADGDAAHKRNQFLTLMPLHILPPRCDTRCFAERNEAHARPLVMHDSFQGLDDDVRIWHFRHVKGHDMPSKAAADTFLAVMRSFTSSRQRGCHA